MFSLGKKAAQQEETKLKDPQEFNQQEIDDLHARAQATLAEDCFGPGPADAKISDAASASSTGVGSLLGTKRCSAVAGLSPVPEDAAFEDIEENGMGEEQFTDTVEDRVSLRAVRKLEHGSSAAGDTITLPASPLKQQGRKVTMKQICDWLKQDKLRHGTPYPRGVSVMKKNELCDFVDLWRTWDPEQRGLWNMPINRKHKAAHEAKLARKGVTEDEYWSADDEDDDGAGSVTSDISTASTMTIYDLSDDTEPTSLRHHCQLHFSKDDARVVGKNITRHSRDTYVCEFNAKGSKKFNIKNFVEGAQVARAEYQQAKGEKGASTGRT